MVHQTPAAKRWSAIIDEHEASGKTIRVFAASRGVNAKTLAWWRSRLGRSRKASSKAARKQKAAASVRFDAMAVASSDPRDRTVVIAFDDLPAHIVVDDDTDLTLLRRVLEAAC